MDQKIKESNLWNWLSKAKDVLKDHLDIQRVENSTGSGTPDVEGHLKGKDSFWIELKTAARPTRNTTPINHGLKPAQIGWIYRRNMAGGNVFVLLQVGSGATAKRYLIEGSQILEFQKPLTEGMIHGLATWTRETSNLTPYDVIIIATGYQRAGIRQA